MRKEEGGKIESVSRTPTTVRDMDEGGGRGIRRGWTFLTEKAMQNNCSLETPDSMGGKSFFLFLFIAYTGVKKIFCRKHLSEKKFGLVKRQFSRSNALFMKIHACIHTLHSLTPDTILLLPLPPPPLRRRGIEEEEGLCRG